MFQKAKLNNTAWKWKLKSKVRERKSKCPPRQWNIKMDNFNIIILKATALEESYCWVNLGRYIAKKFPLIGIDCLFFYVHFQGPSLVLPYLVNKNT